MKPIVPLLFAAPKYLSGELTLGQVTQLAAAFIEVQIAISWVVDNYNRVAEWYASARRVMDIVDACDAIDAEIDAIAPAPTRPRPPRAAPACASPISRSPTAAGRPLLSGADLSAAPGEAVHIHGDSSTGKSTLVRVLAGLWPAARGSLALPDRAQVMITPQKSYLPLDSLKGALLYPNPSLQVSDADLAGGARQGRPRGARAPRSTSARAGTRCCPTASASGWPSPACSFTGRRSSILDDALSALEEIAQAAVLARLRDRAARRHHHQPRPASRAVGRARSPARAGAPRRQRRRCSARMRRRWRPPNRPKHRREGSQASRRP